MKIVEPLFREDRFVDGYLSALLARASALVSTEFHNHLRRKGVPVQVWRVLATLADGDGMIVNDLAAITLLKQPTLTKLLDRMARDGLIERRDASDDRRKTQIFLTPKALEDVVELQRVAKEQEAAILNALDERVLKDMLRRLIVHCAKRANGEGNPKERIFPNQRRAGRAKSVAD